MSFSLWIVVNHDDGYSSHFDIVDGQTYNLGAMWCKTGVIEERIKELDGKPVSEVVDLALAGLIDVFKNQYEYEELNPPNGWGDFEGWFKTYIKFVKMCYQHPKGTIYWSG